MSLGHISKFAARDIRTGDIVHRTTGEVRHQGPVTAWNHSVNNVRLTYTCQGCGSEHVISALPGDGITALRIPAARA